MNPPLQAPSPTLSPARRFGKTLKFFFLWELLPLLVSFYHLVHGLLSWEGRLLLSLVRPLKRPAQILVKIARWVLSRLLLRLLLWLGIAVSLGKLARHLM